MCKLSNWYVSYMQMGGRKTRVAKGIVSGHYRLSDGMHIHTSRIKKIEMDGDVALIYTSNSLYKCDMKDARYDKFKDTSMIEDFDLYKELFGKQEDPSACVDEGEVLIRLGNNREYYYDSACINYKGHEEIIISPRVHVGTFQDSVLSRFDDFENFEDSRFFDYFPYKGRHVEFYSWDDDGLDVYIENIGDAEMYATVKGNVYRIEPGEKKLIIEENMEEHVALLSTEDLYSVYDNKLRMNLIECIAIMSAGSAVTFDEAGNCYVDLTFVETDTHLHDFFGKYGKKTQQHEFFVDKATVEKIKGIQIIADGAYQIRHELYARRPYYRVRGQELNQEQLAQIRNVKHSSGYGMFHDDGVVGCNGHFNYHVSILELIIDFMAMLMECPFLDFMMAISLWNEQHPKAFECEGQESPDKYESKEYDIDFLNCLDAGICVRDNKIYIADKVQAADLYKKYMELYEKEEKTSKLYL